MPGEGGKGLAKRTLSRQIAIAHESRSFILYSAQGTRERLDHSAPKGETRMEQRKEEKERDGEEVPVQTSYERKVCRPP